VSVGIGGAMQVSSIIFDMLHTIWSIWLQACCHWFCIRIALLCKKFVSCCTWFAFVSENLIRNMFMFSCGMGFSILGLLFGTGVCLFGGILM
jgi:hypothetical protein